MRVAILSALGILLTACLSRAADNQLFVLNGVGDTHRHNIFLSDRLGNLAGGGRLSVLMLPSFRIQMFIGRPQSAWEKKR